MSNVEVLQQIAFHSRNLPKSAGIGELTSGIAETHHATDVYRYYWSNKHKNLVSSTHGIPVENVITNSVDRSWYEKTNGWFHVNGNGAIAVWISPPIFPGEIDTKITKMKILEGRNYKMIVNESTLISANFQTVKKISEILYGFSLDPLKRVVSAEELRKDLLIIVKNKDAEEYLQMIIKNKKVWENLKPHIRNARDIYNSNSPNLANKKLENSIGSHSVSCPPVSGEATKSYTGTCPRCGAFGTIYVVGNTVICGSCGAKARINC